MIPCKMIDKIKAFIKNMKLYDWTSVLPVRFEFVNHFCVDNVIDINKLGMVHIDKQGICVCFSLLVDFDEIFDVVKHEHCHVQQTNALYNIGGLDFCIKARKWEYKQFGEESLSEAYAYEFHDVDEYYINFFKHFKLKILNNENL